MSEPVINHESNAQQFKLSAGTGLSPAAYTEPEVYAAETDLLMRWGWLCAGRLEQVPEPGDYLTLDLLGEPLLVVRGRDREVRVLSRVCRHRSADLIPDRPPMTRGHASGFVCPYHAWSYKVDGRLAAAPMMREAPEFDRSRCRLPEFRSETWQGWIFVNLSGDAPPFDAGLEPLNDFLAPYGLEDKVVVGTREFDSPWNWKVLVDNFMESYHHIATHRESLQPVFPAKASSVPDSAGPYSLLVMPSGGIPEEMASTLPARTLPEPLADSLVAAVVYPFHLFAISADVLTWYQLFPDSHDRFRLRVSVCVDRAAAGNERYEEAIEAQLELTAHVHAEDISACDAVWAGMRSRTAVAGPLCAQERALRQFAEWWSERMTC